MDQRSSEGFTVSILGDEIKGESRIVSYSVGLSSGGFTDMLGIPPFVNPDGSYSLPLEYGLVNAQYADTTSPGSGTMSARWPSLRRLARMAVPHGKRREPSRVMKKR